jgi:DNA polymerase III subunit epsilon
MYLFFDTETTGLPKNYKAPVTEVDNWPRLVQLAWMLYDAAGVLVERNNTIVQPEGWTIPDAAARLHGITTEQAMIQGFPVGYVLKHFERALGEADLVVAHNMAFDEKVVGAEFLRLGLPDFVHDKRRACTMLASVSYCALQGQYGFKWPKLRELYKKLFGCEFEGQHNAANDIEATAKCFFELKRLNILTL